MKKQIKNRVFPIFLSLSILVSVCIVPASAYFPDEYRDSYAVADWNSKLLTSGSASLNVLAGILNVNVSAQDIFWVLVDGQLGNRRGETSRSELELLATTFNGYFNRTLAETFPGQIVEGTAEVASNVLARCLIGSWEPYFSVEKHPASGLYRIYENNTGLFVVDSAGAYPYADPTVNDGLGSDQWVPISTMSGGSYRMMSYDALYNLADDIGGRLIRFGDYWVIKRDTSGLVEFVLANEDGKPYVCWYDQNQSATSQDRPQTEVKDEVGEIVEGVLEGLSPGINLEDMILTLPDGGLQFIDDLIYDSFNQTYNIDSHDTYQIENNFYFEYNFSWTYHITHTSITYIGQTEEYDKYYEVYYELPDGRSSADLTKEDLEQLNLSIDVVPYGRSADDTSLRSLYHFDGDTHDESYWNYCTDFVWNTGASLTYMDAGTFNGALYLDENDHDFDILLPSDIGTGDFTLQFRYYQSYTPTISADSSISFGQSDFVLFDGQKFGWDSTAFSAIPTGTWNELAFMREDGILYYYLNGVCFGSVSDDRFFSYELNFCFGSSQQTYKYFDELRVLDYSLVSNGENYAPSAVPHDTNLTLVLPDSSVPVADEFWDIQSSSTNLINGDFSGGELPVGFLKPPGAFPQNGALTDASLYQLGMSSATAVSVNCLKNYALVTQKSAYVGSASNNVSGYNFDYSIWNGGLYVPVTLASNSLVYGSEDRLKWKAGYDLGTELTIAVLLNDGSVYQCTAPAGTITSVSFPGGVIGFDRGSAMQFRAEDEYDCTHLYVAYVAPDVGSSLEIVYVELIEGTSSDLSGEWVESVTIMEAEELNTPTLAVRTDKEITTYQIGGVRPSLPVKGQVWCLVENDRITSIQIYNGSAWEGCDGRIWTGSRWIPASSYNVITLQDMYDIADATPDFEYIYTESGFWTWWQKSWNAFQERLFVTLESGGTGSGDVDLDAVDPEQDPAEEDGKSFLEFILLVVAGGKSVVSGTRELFSGVVSSVPGTMDDLTDAFDSGGLAVGVFDGSSMDPDAGDLSDTAAASLSESEVLDPWRYR